MAFAAPAVKASAVAANRALSHKAWPGYLVTAFCGLTFSIHVIWALANGVAQAVGHVQARRGGVAVLGLMGLFMGAVCFAQAGVAAGY